MDEQNEILEPEAIEPEVIEEPEAEPEAPEAEEEQIVAAYFKRKKRRRIIIGAVAGVLVLLAAFIAVNIYTGALSPYNAAAKYSGLHYIDEDDVTAYIATYREQMGYAEDDVTDEEWATFLATYNLTPSILRTATVAQLIYDQLVYLECEKLGLEVTDEELDTVIESAKGVYGFGDDEIWAETLAMYGQTEEGYRESIELELLRQKLYSDQVEMPTATDEETASCLSYLATLVDDNTTKHSFCLTISYEEDTELSTMQTLQEVRDAFADSSSKEMETFVSLVMMYCDDDDLADNGGAMGWDVDSSSMSTNYTMMLENMEAGDVSTIFEDDGVYCFIWCDETYTFPEDTEELAALSEEDVPETLWEYTADYAAYQLWKSDCEVYLDELYTAANVLIYDMPAGLPYYVDMSLAQTEDEDEESTSEDETEDATEAEDASDEDTE